MKVKGITLTLCTEKSALWWDSDKKYSEPEGKPGFGIMVSLKWGRVIRPIAKFWKREKYPKEYNAWESGRHWFVLDFKQLFNIIPAPFISIAIGKYGFYFGFKTYELGREKYNIWVPQGVNKNGQYLAPSASIRKTRIK
jgi:hypothetical protein